MQNQAIYETLLDRREEWQNNTISEMQEKLNSHPAGKYVVADYKKSLVVVYGNSQIGKTSLILNMLGIKSESRAKVYSVLRANQEYGDSSTVTAIIYMMSPTDSYGMSYSDKKNNEIDFCSESEMIKNLAQLRKNIENGVGRDSILYIFIPRIYFLEEVLEKDSFSIMDLPGINSRNELERNHVESVVSRYMSMATVKVIVTKGDSIQDLVSLEVPEGVDWSAFPNKYFVVVTMAFSQSSVKNYFDIEKSKRDTSFIEYVKDAYKDIPLIVNSSDIEWYPIDVGESFQNLLQTYKDDEKEIVDTQVYFMNQIRDAILSRKGNGLRNIIADLKSYSKDYYRVNIAGLKKSIQDKEENIKLKQEHLIKIRAEKDKYENIIAGFTTTDINKFRDLEKYNLNSFLKELSDKIERFLNSIAENYPTRIKDHDLKIVASYLAFVDDVIKSCSSLELSIGESLYKEIYPGGIYLELRGEITDILEQQKLELTNLFRPKGVSYFFTKVNRVDVVTRLLSLSNIWKQVVSDSINCKLADVLRGTTAEKERYFQISQLFEYKKNEEEKLVLEVNLLNVGLEEDIKNLRVWEKKESTDSELLATYFNVARQEYLKCKDQLKKEMQGLTRSEKLQYMLLLGLMEHDYNVIMEGEESWQKII